MINLLDKPTYWAYWYGIRENCPTDKDAWELVEERIAAIYGIGMYETHEAFRRAKSRYTMDPQTGKCSTETLADIVTVPGYMEAYERYKSSQSRKVHRKAGPETATLFTGSKDTDTAPASESEVWHSFNHHVAHLHGLQMYDTYSAFKSARLRYIQSKLRKKNIAWKTKPRKKHQP